MSSRLRLRYLIPALLVGIIALAGPIIALLGTSANARILFVILLAIVTPFLYQVRSWRKQAGIGIAVVGIECVFLVIAYFIPELPLRSVVLSYLGKTSAQYAWQGALGLSFLLIVAGALIFLWGLRAHRDDAQ